MAVTAKPRRPTYPIEESILTLLSLTAIVAILLTSPPHNIGFITLQLVTAFFSGFAVIFTFSAIQRTSSFYKPDKEQQDEIVRKGGLELLSVTKDTPNILLKKIQLTLTSSSISRMVIHSCSLTLFIWFTIRLFSKQKFDSYPPNLDFGPKYYGPDYNGEISQNIAFIAEFNSFGHCVQGFMASLLTYPAVNGSIARMSIFQSKEQPTKAVTFWKRIPNVYMLHFLQLFCAFMTIYPSYSMIKRATPHWEYFAQSSHLNNVTEWLIGYFLGIATGILMTSYVLRTLWSTVMIEFDSCINAGGLDLFVDDIEKPSLTLSMPIDEFGEANEFESNISQDMLKFVQIAKILQYIIVLLFFTTTVFTAVALGVSWNPSISYGASGLISIFLAMFALVIITMYWFKSVRNKKTIFLDQYPKVVSSKPPTHQHEAFVEE
mmetsp:Transcript_2630/g.3101  ORF Transcript_2630/g.3101 Transcript_2630/m.3101 type:complete len:433 (+) Transcript_2630:102-1400(+)